MRKGSIVGIAPKEYTNLVEFLLNCGIEVSVVLEFPEYFNGKITLFHIASFYFQVEVIKLLIERRVDINIHNDINQTAAIQLLLLIF
jgi:hypothetical protein